MPRLHLTDRALRSLRTELVQEEFYDTVLPGFGVRVGKGKRRKTYFVRYRSKGRNRRMTLGHYPAVGLAEAREQARALMGDIARRIDPAAQRERAPAKESFGKLAEAYLEWARANKRESSVRLDAQLLRHDLLPPLAKLSVDEVGRTEVLAISQAALDRGSPVAANKAFALLRRIYRWGIARDLAHRDPCEGMEKPAVEKSRDRVLSIDETRRLWRLFDLQSPSLAAAFKILLLTAQRRAEVTNLRWSDLRDNVWTIPGESSKRGYNHVLPITGAVRKLLDGLERTPDRDWIFPSPNGRSDRMHPDTLNHVSIRLARESGISWRIHDLRRTAASRMAELGVSTEIVDRILGHSVGGVSSIYNRYSYLREMRHGLELWSDLLQLVLGEHDGETRERLIKARAHETDDLAHLFAEPASAESRLDVDLALSPALPT